jgi:flap endonuclease-1
MGIKLGEMVVKRPLQENELDGKIVAFDTYNMLYQFLSSIRTPEGHPLSNSNGRIISHLKGIFSRLSNLVEKGMKPVMVFDGKPHELKKGTLDMRRERREKARKEWELAVKAGDMERARSKAMQTSHLTEDMVEETKRLLSLMGIPSVEAPMDGEAQASHMCIKGDVFAVSSQDYDSLLFGCPLLVRNLGVSGRRKNPYKKSYSIVEPEVIDLKGSLHQLNISREQLVDMAVMIGTDFNEGVHGIGPKKSLRLVREMNDLETITKEKRIPLLEFDQIRKIFLEPSVTDQYEIQFHAPDEDGLRGMLVDELGFGSEGVNKNIEMLMRIKVNDVVSEQVSLDGFI